MSDIMKKRLSTLDIANMGDISAETWLFLNTALQETKRMKMGDLVPLLPPSWAPIQAVANVTAANRQMIVADASALGSPLIVALPPAATSSGFLVVIKKKTASVNYITIDPDGAELIDGAATKDLRHQHNAVFIGCDGVEWWVLSEIETAVGSKGQVSYFNTTGKAITIAGVSNGSTNMVKVDPTTAMLNALDFSNGGGNNGRLQYTGVVTKYFEVDATVTIDPATNNDSFVIGIAKNGTVDATSKAMQKCTNNGQNHGMSIHVLVQLAQNDYVEVYIGNMTNIANVTVKSLNIVGVN